MAVGFPTKANWAAGDVLTASAMDDLAGTVNTVQYLKPWNQVLNSNFSVWQRGTSVSATNASAYTADRWYMATGGSMTCTTTRQPTNDTTNLPNIQYCARVQRNAGQTATGNWTFQQSFETVNTIPLAGKQVTLSWYARAGSNYSPTGSLMAYGITSGTGVDQNVQNGYTGAYGVAGGSVTLTTTWQRFSVTATVPTTATEIAILFGQTSVGTAGTNDYFEITGVQLELGSVANTYQPNASTFQGELAACQRYYQRATGASGYSHLSSLGSCISTTQLVASLVLKTTMRVTPTAIDYSNLALDTGATATAVSSITINSQSNADVVDLVAVSSGLTQFRPAWLCTNNGAGYVGVSAEL